MPSAGSGHVKTRRFVQRHRASSGGSVVCAVVTGWGMSRTDWGMLGRGNKRRVENNRARQWHNLWLYFSTFNWPVSFSHLMHFHKDSSLHLVLCCCSSLDFPVDSVSGFLFCSPPFQSSAELPGFVMSQQKGRFSKGAVWEDLTLSSTGGEIWCERRDCQWPTRVCSLSQISLHCATVLNVNPHPSHV